MLSPIPRAVSPGQCLDQQCLHPRVVPRGETNFSPSNPFGGGTDGRNVMQVKIILGWETRHLSSSLGTDIIFCLVLWKLQDWVVGFFSS